MPAQLPHRTRGATFDAAVFGLGAAVAGYGVAQWVVAGYLSSGWVLLVPVVLVVLAQFPLIIFEGGADAVIGFEFSVLVYLALTTTKLEAGALWAIGTTLADVCQRKSIRTRAFNVGLTNLLGPVSVNVLVRAKPVALDVWRELLWVGIACAGYFLLDLIVTGVSLTVDGEGRLSETVPGHHPVTAGLFRRHRHLGVPRGADPAPAPGCGLGVAVGSGEHHWFR